GVALANRAVTLFVRPVPLPGLELRSGVPESLRTLVAVPTLLTTPEEDRGTGRAARDPPSGESRRRSALCSADGLGRRGRRSSGRRCGTGRRRARRHCLPQSTLRPCGRGPALPPAAPSEATISRRPPCRC